VEIKLGDDYTTNDAHFHYFKQSCNKWQEKLSLCGWEIIYRHIEDSKNVAWEEANIDARCATISLNKSWREIKPTKRELNLTAFHEICELLLERIDRLARAYYADSIIDEPRHEIINVLQKTIWQPYWEKHRK
jgi:hypothetical protein